VGIPISSCPRRILALGLLALLGCGGSAPTSPPPAPPPPTPPPPPPPGPASVASVSLNQTAITLVPLQTSQLVATARDAGGNVLSGRIVAWSSGAGAIAGVDQTGLVSGVAAGPTTITAAVEGKSATASVTVVPGGLVGPAGGAINAFTGNVSLTIPAAAVGAPVPVTVTTATGFPAHARLAPGTAYTFGPSGTVFAQPAALAIRYEVGSLPAATTQSRLRLHRLTGGVWVAVAGSTVTVGTRTVSGNITGFSTYAIVEVPIPVATVEITPPTPAVALGASIQLTATARSQGGAVLPNRPATWVSLDQDRASVSETGLVTGLTDGPARITATIEGVVAQTSVVVGSPFFLTSLSIGGSHTCALTSAQEAWCWGGWAQNLGNGSLLDTPIPTRVAGDRRFLALDAGVDDDAGPSCAIDIEHLVWCWGNRTGDGTTVQRLVPVRIQNDLPFERLAIGDRHACALATDQVVWCWGANNLGQVGDGTTIGRNGPVRVTGTLRFKRIGAGDDITCGITTTDQTHCWGMVVDQTNTYQSPQPINPDPGLVEVSAGQGFACGLTAAGVAWCWGANIRGTLGNGTDASSLVPVRVSNDHVFTEISAGHWHVCARKSNGEVWCWGDNHSGGLGDGTVTHRNTPVKVLGHVFAKVDAGAHATCGLKANGEGWCWGSNFSGQLGDRSQVFQQTTPVRIVPP